MSSSGIRGIRRKKSSLGEVKVAVVGAPGVGKSALIVRFLTRRYIGEYDHQNENRYKHEMMVDSEPVLYEILDSCPKTGNELVSAETVQWADGFLLVYSITDRQSFNYIKRVKQQLTETRSSNTLTVASPHGLSASGSAGNLHSGGGGGSNNNGGFSFSRDNSSSSSSPSTSIVLVANKADLVHLRQVSQEEGETLAKDLDCSFAEVAASEQVTQVAEVFHEVCREVQTARRKTKQSLLDRVLGNKAAAGLRVYARGKSDSALPKESN
ncbi:ras-related and estrogen-regulated growth inhibitor [Folsomia candida]|uniref:ras-related and estrogen-regulated growth inhibitor n=1 Tax=Folsomia candida TaxID=158441 RepID=UPI000B8FBC63|nr:ras-related and estrogen-regulated growth inhibitor [Folsomia candida]